MKRPWGIYWIPLTGRGAAQYVTCAGAIEKFNHAWATELERSFAVLGRKFFTGRFIANSGSIAPKLVMSSQLQDTLKSEIKKNLFNVSSYLGDIAISAEETLKQALIINGIADSAAENSKLAGTYAETRALEQQHITFDSIGRLAAKLLPIMKAVIEALAYACFIFVIPLCMIPNGYKFLLNWISVLVWLQAWAPMYAILNYIMNIAARASTISEIGTAGGLTIANYIGVADANSEIKLLAGYLVMSVPFICIAIVKGLGSFIHLAGQMTGTSMQVAGTAGGEVATGNFSFGNINMRNQSYDNFSQLQRNFSSSLAAGGHRLDTGGVQITNDALRGTTTTHRAKDDFMGNTSKAVGTQTGNNTVDINTTRQMGGGRETDLTSLRSTAEQTTARFTHGMSKMTDVDIRNEYGFTAEAAKNLSHNSKIVDSYYTGHNYNDQTHASGGFSAGASFGTSVGNGKGFFKKIGGFFNVSIGGNVCSGVQATNSTNKGDSHSGITAQEYNEALREVQTAMKKMAKSEKQDELTQLARDYQRTVQEIDSLSTKETSFDRNSRNYQDAQHYGNSITVTRNTDITHQVYELAEQKYSRNKAIDIMSLNTPEYQKIRASLENEVTKRNNINLTPTRPSAPTQNEVFKDNEYSKTQAELKQKYGEKSQKSDEKITEIDNRMKKEKENLQTNNFKVNSPYRFNDVNSSINTKGEQIKNGIETIKEKVQKRGEKCVAEAALDKLSGNDDK